MNLPVRALFAILVTAFLGPPLCSQTQIISLDGEWQFAIDSAGTFRPQDVGQKGNWRTAIVPLSWQAQFADLRDYSGVAWYRKSFSLPKIKNDEIVLMTFGAVDYLAQVYVNGMLVGTHEGGYLPFSFDIRRWTKYGKNEILVRVMDPASTEQGTEGISYRNIPHGKQSWYVQTSGLWQSVQIQMMPQRYISDVHITPSINGRIDLTLRFNQSGKKDRKDLIVLRIVDPEKKETSATREIISAATKEITFIRNVNNPQLWDVDSPNLYTIEVTLNSVHLIHERFGFRSIEAAEGKILLNGRPFYLIGALDQDFYPATIYTTPSEEYLRDEMLKAKKLGLNTLRCHIKVPDPRYLKVADEVGLLVWYEIPNWDVLSNGADKRGEETLDGMLSRDWNHPSLCILSIINESWGIDLQKADQRAWLKEAFNRAKKKATGRLVVDNSACWGNFHVKTDINDYHTYWAIPENTHRFDQTMIDFAQRPAWLFSTFGDAEETKQEPLLLSEFGNWGLPKLPEEDPWWFGRKFGNATVAFPLGVQDRFHRYRYERIFGTYNRLAEESQQAQWSALKYEIEQIRLQPEIQGYVITEFTDINWECNGLLDMWRNPKYLAQAINDIQRPDVIIPRLERYNYWINDTVRIQVSLSKYSDIDFRDAKLRWSNSDGQSGEIPISVPNKVGVPSFTPISFVPVKKDSVRCVRIDLGISAAGDQLLANNYIEIFVFPYVLPTADADVTLYDPLHVLSSLAGIVGTKTAATPSAQVSRSIIVTNVLDDSICRALENGAAVLCLADTNTQCPEGFPAKLVGRENSWYDGNWASNLNWLEGSHPVFRGISFSNHLGFEAAGTVPDRVLADIAPEHFSDVIAGMFVGWVHLNSGYLMQMNAGRGKLLVCTFRIADHIQSDPYASLLLNRLTEYIASPECTPATEWNLQ